MPYLLDTNILSDLIRDPQGQIAKRIADVGEASICTSIVVAAELRYGAAKRGSARLTAQMTLVLDRLEVLSLDAPADAIYGDLRARLEAAGTPIGANDMLIAAHAMSLGCTIVTDNIREFARIDGPACENWLRPD
jgi:tRNA(fMet)-specific endonuclease VapC